MSRKRADIFLRAGFIHWSVAPGVPLKGRYACLLWMHNLESRRAPFICLLWTAGKGRHFNSIPFQIDLTMSVCSYHCTRLRWLDPL